MAESAYLVIRRWSRWVYRIRRFDILVDGHKVGSIANGSEETIPVTPGQHVVELRISYFFKSEAQTVQLEANEKVLLECGTPLTVQKMLPLILVIALQGLLSRHTGLIYVIPILLVSLLVLGYCIWLYCGRGKFLCLKAPQKL